MKLKIKQIDFGIRNKVLLGFVVIGLMLFTSGVIAFFEFGRMSERLSVLLSNNMSNLSTSTAIFNLVDKENTILLEKLRDDNLSHIPSFSSEKVLSQIKLLQQNYTNDKERALADSINYSYVAYIQVINELESVWFDSYQSKNEWYFSKLQLTYEKLRGYIQKYYIISQSSVGGNFDNLNESFYRSIMPGIIAIAVGIVLVILFNYFINLFILKPIIRINKALKNYRDIDKEYNVTFDYGGDQLQELNDNIKDIVDENIALKKK